MKDHTLGILSGIGAAAGMHMATRLVEEAQRLGARTDADFPDFVLYNMPCESTNEKGIADPLLLLGEIAMALKKFNIWGCDFLLLACNTIHQYLPEMRDRFGGLIINMVELAANEASASKRVGVICSQSTRDSGIYRRALDAYGIEALYPSDEAQEWINKAIDSAICGDHPERNWKGLHGVDVTLRSRGCGHVIIGCTELPLCLRGHPLGAHAVDAGECAVRHALRLLSPGAPVPS